MQMPDIASTDVTDVMKPHENGEETATMFDRELEAVVLIKENKTLCACLMADTKETGIDHNVLKTVKARSSFGVPFDRELATPRTE